MEREEKNRKQGRDILVLAVLLLTIFSSFAAPRSVSAARKTWNVKVNNTQQAKLVKKKDQWYLKSDTINLKSSKSTERACYLKISSKSGLNSGYYYFAADGRVDQRKMFHNLDTKIGNIAFKGKYYFGNPGGRLYQKTGWVTVKGKKYAVSKMGKMYTSRWYKGYYLMENGRIATSRQVSNNANVDADGKKCKKEEVRLSVLKKKLQSTLNGYSGSWSVYVKDLKTNDVLSINEVSMYPASVIKLFVMEAVYAGVKEKRISLNANTKNLLSNMIIYSDNESYNQLVRDLGGGSFASGCYYINQYIKKMGGTGSGVHFSLHPSSSSYQGDGLGGNRGTAKDVGLLLERIYRKKAVSKKYSSQMLNLLLQQDRTWKIPAGLPSGVKCANKTGETDSEQHDAAIVFGKKTDYVIVIFSSAGEYNGINGIRKISSMVYDYLN